MKKSNKILLCVIGIFLVTSILIGISYAYYIFSVSQSGSNVVRTDCFEITYSDGNAINLSNTIPLSDVDAMELEPYIFTINNVCNHDVVYDVNLETLNTSTIDLNGVKVRLDNSQPQILGNIEDNDSSTIVNNDVLSSKTIRHGAIRANSSKTYNLRIYIDENSTLEETSSKSFLSKIVITTTLGTVKSSTLISGPEFNTAIKKIAGDTVEEFDGINTEELAKFAPLPQLYFSDGSEDNIEEIMHEVREFLKNNDNSSSHISNIDELGYYELLSIVDSLIGDDDFLILLILTYPNANTYQLSSSKIKNIFVSNTPPSSEIQTSIVSTEDSEEETVAWFEDNNIYLYSNAPEIYANEDMSFALSFMQNLETAELDRINFSKTKKMIGTFFAAINLNTKIYLDTSNVDDVSFLYAGTKVDFDDYSHLDLSSAKNAIGLFYATILYNYDFSTLDLSNVENISGMFSAVYSTDMKPVTSLPITGLNTSNVKRMSALFADNIHAKQYDLSYLDTSNAVDISFMFANNTSLENLDISNFNTENILLAAGMFVEDNLASIDLSNFNTTKLISTYRMFDGANELETVYVSNDWNLSNVSLSDKMFNNDTNLVGGAGTTYDANHTDKEYARIDDPTNENPGYFTLKTN